MRVLVVDDEPLARDALAALLEGDRDIVSIEMAAGVDQALRLIHRVDPHIVFLDVEMPEGDGFSLMRRLGNGRNPAVIFVTAFEQYAIPAFECNAVDYLLKPVSRERFHAALERAKSRIGTPSPAASGQYLQRIAVKTTTGIRLVKIHEVEWLEACENYVRIHVDQKQYLLHATLNKIIENLDPSLFARVHRSAVVSIDAIIEVQSAAPSEYVLLLKSGARVRTGRSYSQSLRSLLSNFT